MIGFTLGTGLGGGIAIGGRVQQGHDGTAGELGHQTIDLVIVITADRIVIGGGVSAAAGLLRGALEAELRRRGSDLEAGDR